MNHVQGLELKQENLERIKLINENKTLSKGFLSQTQRAKVDINQCP